MAIITRFIAMLALAAMAIATGDFIHAAKWADRGQIEGVKSQSKQAEKRKLKNLPAPINTRYNEFAPSLTADGNTMVFNSNRYGKYQDIYITKKVKGQWSHPEKIAAINSRYNDETPFISADGSMLIFASDRDGSLEMPRDSRGRIKVSFDLYWSVNKNGVWQRPRKVPHTNTQHHERAPSISNDGRYIFFARWPFGQLLKTRIMYGELTSQWVKNIKELPPEVNSNFAEAAFVPAQNRPGFFFSAARKDSIGGWDIYYISFKNGKFGKATRQAGAINSKGNDLYLSTTKDNIYFCSNREGGLGGYDIYSYQLEKVNKYIVKLINKKTMQPVRATARMRAGNRSFAQESNNDGVIEVTLTGKKAIDAIAVRADGYKPYANAEPKFKGNTLEVLLDPIEKIEEKDIIVRLHDKKTGAPVVASASFKIGKRSFTKPANEKGEIKLKLKGNEQIDEINVIKKGYEKFKSEHPKFEDNEYTALLTAKAKDKQFIVKLVNKKTGAPVVGKVAYIVNGKQTKWPSDSSGRVGLRVKAGESVAELSVIKPGFMPYHRVNPQFTDNGHVAYLEPIEKEKSFTLHNIHFDFNSARLKTKSKPYLQALADFIKQNNNLRFRIIGHTDLNGSKAYNQKLSLKRAQAVKNFLVKTGIDAKRFEVAGAGLSRPVVKAKNAHADALNRRTEFRIISN